MGCLAASPLSAQEAAGPASSVILRPAPFASWSGEAHLNSTGTSLLVSSGTAVTWWGLNTGATVGATAALGLTQAFCADDNGCVGRTIGAVLMGSLLGGALEAGMEY